MATIERPKEVSQSPDPQFTTAIPEPFPRELLRLARTQEDIARPATAPALSTTNSTPTVEHPIQGVQHEPAREDIQDIVPSVYNVQNSCLMILDVLLSSHLFCGVVAPPTHDTTSGQSSPSLLHALISKLRQLDSGESMVEIAPAHNDTALLWELQGRVDRLFEFSDESPSVDAQLAKTLVFLLNCLQRLLSTRAKDPITNSSLSTTPLTSTPANPDVYDTLKRSLAELQNDRNLHTPPHSSPVSVVENTLLWSQIDALLEQVMTLCRQRQRTLEPLLVPSNLDVFPPEYDLAGSPTDDILPAYDGPQSSLAYEAKDMKRPSISQERLTSATIQNEKMRLDLEAVTIAIDRLYLVAPQLLDQRVELKASKMAELEKARLAGNSKGKQKQGGLRELEHMVEMIGRASERRITEQTYVMGGDTRMRQERARRRESEQRQAFVEQLAGHSDSGRLHDQEAVINNKTKSLEALLTLPEFIREPVPPEVVKADPHAVLTLPEFMKEPVPPGVDSPKAITKKRSLKGLRNRSLSAPSLDWIFSSGTKTPPERKALKLTKSSSQSIPDSDSLELSYVAECHESLQHVMVFFNVTGAIPGINIEVDIQPSADNTERFLVLSGTKTTFPSPLPARVSPGKPTVKVQSGHFELKLPTIGTPGLPTPSAVEMYDATALSKSMPTTFICSSCSLPLVQSTKVREYKDLPSEHWQELVDAWMCHSDQKLHEEVMENAKRGFWPKEGEALVGGSYIVFEDSGVIKTHLCQPEAREREDWFSVKCICGASVGRTREQPSLDGDGVTCYRLAKYAIKPVSPTAEPLRIPLSSFIVEDMMEYVQSHATYRFILHDDEEERPRILIWLFKPSMRIAYSTLTQRLLSKVGNIHGAKVLYRILGPETASTDLTSIVSRYPGFPQAEHLSYPLDICRRLAGLLKESNSAYPESMKVMTGLDVGFLQRS